MICTPKLFGQLAGLAAMAIGLGKETSNHTAELITPILTCLTGLLMTKSSHLMIVYNLYDA